MFRTQYSHLTNEEFHRLLVSQPCLSPLEVEAMLRLEALMDDGDRWDGGADSSDVDVDELVKIHDSMEGEVD